MTTPDTDSLVGRRLIEAATVYLIAAPDGTNHAKGICSAVVDACQAADRTPSDAVAMMEQIAELAGWAAVQMRAVTE